VPYLSTLEVCSRRGAIQIHVYLYLYHTHSLGSKYIKKCVCSQRLAANTFLVSGFILTSPTQPGEANRAPRNPLAGVQGRSSPAGPHHHPLTHSSHATHTDDLNQTKTLRFTHGVMPGSIYLFLKSQIFYRQISNLYFSV